MSIKTVFINEQLWNKVFDETKEAVEAVLGRERIINNYVANILDKLRIRGEYNLADEIEDELTEILKEG